MSQTHAVVNVDFFQPVMPEGAISFEKALKVVAGLTPEKSAFKASGDPAIARRVTLVDGLWDGELGRFRVDDRPLAGTMGGKVRDVDLEKDEEICEDTAIVYCPKRNVVAMQAGRVKISETAFANMVAEHNGIQEMIRMEPLLKLGALEKLKAANGGRKVIFKIRDISSANQLAAEAKSTGTGFNELTSILKTFGASDLDLMISLGSDHDKTKRERIKRFALDLFKLTKGGGGRVDEISFYGDDVDGESLVLDLIADRVRRPYKIQKVGGRCPISSVVGKIREDLDDACLLAGIRANGSRVQA
jgi:hypothetical protein